MQTIQNCFQEALDSQLMYQEPVDQALIDSIQASFSKLQRALPTQVLMDITTFLYPIEETVQNTLEDIDIKSLLNICQSPRKIQRKS